MPVSLARLRNELMQSLNELGLDPKDFLLSPEGRKTVEPTATEIRMLIESQEKKAMGFRRGRNEWEEVARAICEIGAAAGVDVKVSLNLSTDTMCAKVAGNTYTVTRKDVEDRNFGQLYAALGQAAAQQKLLEQQMRAQQNYDQRYGFGPGYVDNSNFGGYGQSLGPGYDSMSYISLAQLKSEGRPVYADPEYEQLRGRGFSPQAVREVADFMNEDEVRAFDPQSSFVVSSPPIDLSQDEKVAAPAPASVPELDLD